MTLVGTVLSEGRQRGRKAAKAAFKHVSWQHPLVRLGLPVVNLVDRLVRFRHPELRALPAYSIRIRSRGVHAQFGGRRTAQSSAKFVAFMRDRAGLSPTSRVLDIGCGCGLTALALADYLERGHYTGIDVDMTSIDACRRNKQLAEADFNFLHAPVEGDVYTGGDQPAAIYRFPLEDASFTHIIMCSVITHLLPAEVENYLNESARLLEEGGTLVFSTFLTDFGPGKGAYTFPVNLGHYRLISDTLQRKGVAYSLDFLDGIATKAGLAWAQPAVIGSWREDPEVPVVDPLGSGQDLLIATRRTAG